MAWSYQQRLPKIAQKVKDNAFTRVICYFKIVSMKQGKQLRHVSDQMASVNIESSFALNENKGYHSH